MAKADQGVKQSIEELQKRFQKLNEKRVEAAAHLKSAQNRLDELKKEALERYQTDDLDQLRAKLKEMQDENERKRSQYQSALEKIESDLADVERNYEAADGKGNGK
jgi:chromosome segregation ATPase